MNSRHSGSRSDPFAVLLDRFQPPESPLARYLADSAGFANECIDWGAEDGLTGYQAEILAAVPIQRRVSVRGPHGLGKTTYSAVAVLWFALTRDAAGIDWKVATTAGAWRQLELYLWPEIHKWARKLRWDKIGRDPFTRDELLRLNLKLRHGSAFAVASDVPALIEGVHADSLLYVLDEAKSIAAAIFDSAEGAFAAEGIGEAFAIANSTPGEPIGRFYDIHAKRPGLEDWWVRHVTLDEAIEAGRVSSSWAEQRGKQWGDQSALYANRVLGEFHSSDEDGVIPLSWVEAAVERWQTWDAAGRPDLGPVTRLGVDVARSGRDNTVVALRHGDIVSELRLTHHEDTMTTAGRVGGILEAHPGAIAVVDTDGLGAGVTDRLREQGRSVVAFHAGAGTSKRDSSGELGFANVRSAAWWSMREKLDPAAGSTVMLPPDDLLIGDLCAPHWKVASNSRIQVESKDEIRKRLGRSTDSGDAVIQAFWETPPWRRARVKRVRVVGW